MCELLYSASYSCLPASFAHAHKSLVVQAHVVVGCWMTQHTAPLSDKIPFILFSGALLPDARFSWRDAHMWSHHTFLFWKQQATTINNNNQQSTRTTRTTTTDYNALLYYCYCSLFHPPTVGRWLEHLFFLFFYASVLVFLFQNACFWFLPLGRQAGTRKPSTS